MIQLPEDFLRATRAVMGTERFDRYLKALEEEAPVSIRLNPLSTLHSPLKKIPWCRTGYYLPTRPQFTFDPLLHAGCYYVQEASSMFLDEVLRQHLPEGRLAVLDLCAAPGGKSTLIRSAISEDSILVSNEPIRKRAQILSENIQKWGYANCVVTNNYPKDFARAGLQFDVILCDVPCSGEGMFRKDPDTIGEWSLAQVERCWQLQREIVTEAWKCLCPDGLLIYSTCTYNIKENEENVRWIIDELGAEPLGVDIQAEWNITGSLQPGFDVPVYRFIPGLTKGEGFFLCVMRKPKYQNEYHRLIQSVPNRGTHATKPWYSRYQTLVATLPDCGTDNANERYPRCQTLAATLPDCGTDNANERYPRVELSYPQAIAYLRGEALVLPPDTPRGLVTLTFMQQPLGQAKNIGTRANNLYPKEWRIKSTHVPNTYTPVIFPHNKH